MMKAFFATVAAVAMVAALMMMTAPQARADGGDIAAGVVGGLIGGALLGGAIAQRPAYGYGYAPAPVYVAPPPAYYGPPCRWERQRFWDGYGWRMRRIEVCD